MKDMVRYGLILMVVCAVAAGLLAGVNALTRGKILSQAQAEEESSLKELMEEAATFEAVGSGEDVLYYRALDINKKLLGAVFKASGKGYGGDIQILAGMLVDGTVTGIKVVQQNETPGLGAQVAEPGFTDRFKKRACTGLSEIDTITGATISSSAVIKSVSEKAAEILPLLKNG